jgi:DNA-nicking Smr family endonuclease
MYQPGGQLSVDLHGSSVREAKVSLQETFDAAKEKGLYNVTFITGVGKHSKNNYSVLFNKTVPEFLKQPEIKAQISQVKRDRGGAYEIVFQNQDVSEKIKRLKEIFVPIIYPDQDFEQIKQR